MTSFRKIKINGREFVKCQMINFEFIYPILSIFAFLWSIALLVKLFVYYSFVTWTALALSPIIFIGGTIMIFTITMISIFALKSILYKGKIDEDCTHGP